MNSNGHTRQSLRGRSRRRRPNQHPFTHPYQSHSQYGVDHAMPVYQQNTSQQQQNYVPYQQMVQQPNLQQQFTATGSNQSYFQNYIPYPNPYPKPVPQFKQSSSGFQTVVGQFKKQDGQFDFNKMMDTAGQMMSAANQMGSLFKGVTSIFKV